MKNAEHHNCWMRQAECGLGGNIHRSKRPSSVAALRRVDPSSVATLRTSSVALRRVERVEGDEGDSVGETPTGATGTVALPQLFGLEPVKSRLENSVGPVFAARAVWQASCLPVAAASSRQLVFDWRGVPEPGAGCPGTGRQDARPTSPAKISRRRTPRSFQAGSMPLLTEL